MPYTPSLRTRNLSVTVAVALSLLAAAVLLGALWGGAAAGGLAAVACVPLLTVLVQRKVIRPLRQSQDARGKFEFIANAVPDSMSLIDRDYRYEAVNRTYCRNAGKEAADVVGKTVFEVWGDEVFQEKIRPNLDRCFQGEEVGYESWIEFRDEDSKFYQVRYYPYYAPSGEVTHVAVISRDTTKRKLAEEALERARDELEERVKQRTAELTSANESLQQEVAERRRLETHLLQAKHVAEEANRSKSEFLANMSHEIRTPLGGVIGMTEILLESGPDPDTARTLQTIISEANALMVVINEILDFSKIESGKMEMEHISFDLEYLLEDFAGGFAVQAARKGLDFVWSLDPNVPAHVTGDPGRLRQILNNLTGNAIKFTAAGEVTVRGELEEDTGDAVLLRFSVGDTGIGIPADKQQTIFEPFTQADGSTSRQYGGTGLGVTISRRFAEMMGGSMGLNSEEGKGCEFWFTLRLAKSGEASPDPLPQASLEGVRVLVVEPNESGRRALREMLEGWGCTVSCAATPEEGATLHKHTPGDIFLVSARNTGDEGCTLVRRLRAAEGGEDLPVALINVVGSRGDPKLCSELNLGAYLTRPLRRSDLYRGLAGVLGLRDAGAEDDPRPLVTRHVLAEAERGRRRVLLAEDYPTNQQVALKHLQNAGLAADLAVNGREAVEFFASQRYDAVLMDVQMPVMDGYEATQAMRELEAERGGRRTPIIATTAHAMKGDCERCLAAGMDDYLAKPLRRQALLDMLAKWLRDDDARSAESAAPTEEVAVETAMSTGGPGRVMDYDRALHEFEDDEPFLREVMEGFVEHLRPQLERLQNALDKGDAGQVQAEAHAIKGGAANLTAMTLSEVAKRLEDMGRDDVLEEGPTALQELRERFEEFVAYLESLPPAA